MANFILTGGLIGLLGVLLSYFGNPANTGFCVSCFMENIAGSLGMHANPRMQYIRPEIIGFVLGSFLTAVSRRDLRPAGGSSPLLRFFIGVLLIVGCAVFMGCPIKMLIRISAGDITALTGLAGLSAGVFIGIKFIEGGFSLGEAVEQPAGNAFIIPAFMFFLLLMLIWRPGFISLSIKGAGAQHAPIFISLSAGLAAGSLAQITGFCITGGIARLFLWGPKEVKGCPKSSGLLAAIFSFFITALVASILTGQFYFGIHGQPSSNESHLWNFLGMLMVGFGSVLIKGCPFRQLVRAGQGDGDAGATVLGMLTGASLVQNWKLGGNSAGTPYQGQIAVLAGLCALLIIGLIYRKRQMTMAREFQTGLD